MLSGFAATVNQRFHIATSRRHSLRHSHSL